MCNVQHDCYYAKCIASGRRRLYQERVETSLTEDIIKHQKVEQFVINMAAFHNAHLIHASLPCSLVAPVPLYYDQQARHHANATTLQSVQASKRSGAKVHPVQKRPPSPKHPSLAHKKQKTNPTTGIPGMHVSFEQCYISNLIAYITIACNN